MAVFITSLCEVMKIAAFCGYFFAHLPTFMIWRGYFLRIPQLFCSPLLYRRRKVMLEYKVL